jgi:hypothetical protein
VCTHRSKIGDNYGLSCADCGAQLEGYGCGGNGDGSCHHRFLPDGTDEELCVYCLQAPVPANKLLLL